MHFDWQNAYLFRRVTSAKEFCLCVLLSCCLCSEDDWAELLAVSQCNVDNPVESGVAETEGNEGAALRGTIGWMRRKRMKGGWRNCAMRRWEAKRLGVQFMGSEELLRCG